MPVGVRFAIVIGGNRREREGIPIVLQRQCRDRALQLYEVVIDAVRDLSGKAGARRLDRQAPGIRAVVVFRILVSEREVGGELIVRLGGNREARAVGLGGVGVRLTGEQVGDPAAIVIVVADKTNAEFVLDDRRIEHRVTGVRGGTGFGLRTRDLSRSAELREVRLVGDVTYRACERTGTEQRALRTAQHLDSLDVDDAQVAGAAALADRIDRHVVVQQRHGRLLQTQVGTGGHTADGEVGRIPAARTGVVETRRGIDDVLQLRRAAVLEFNARFGGNAHRHVLQTLGTLGRGDDNFRQRIR